MRRLSLVALLALAPVAAAQQGATVPDPDPEIERKTFVVPPGFEVNLFAADPMLAKPIQMNFDPQGRLWVAASAVYPQVKPGEVADDKVLILEDTNGDGKADKTTVFADGLLIPTGVIPGDGGAYVADSTDLVHFSDPDPATGKARTKRIVLSGFGTEDTHHILHTFRYGPDATLTMNQSVYIHSHIETPHGVRHLNAGGVWRFRPETVQLDVFARGFWNAWGTQFDRWGRSFATDGANGEGPTLLVPGAAYSAAKWDGRILHGMNPGSPKHCGLEVLSGRHLPPEYVGSLVTNDFRGHRVCRFTLKPDGSGFQSTEQQELIRSTHPAFRPIDVAMGPDGAVYVADWYNPIIQHGEVDFRDPRRDHTHGRIWRITATGRPLVERPKLVGAPVVALLDQLKSPEDWTRLQAKRVLRERGAGAVLPELTAWTAALDKADPEYAHHQLEALWAYAAFDSCEPKLLAAVLTSPDPRARAAACRVAGDWAGRLPDAVALLAPRALDDAPAVRLEAVRALARVPSPKAAEAAMAALDKPADQYVEYAVWLTTRELAPHWAAAAASGELTFGGKPERLVYALQAAGSGDVARVLVQLLKTGQVPADKQAGVYAALAAVGGPDELGEVVRAALTRHAAADGALLTAVEAAVRGRKVRPPVGVTLIPLLGDRSSPAARQAACRLAGLWKQEDMRAALEHVARTAPAADGRAAIDGLALLGGPKSVAFLTSATGADRPAPARRAAVVALASLDVKAAAAKAAELLAGTPTIDDPAEVVAAFANRADGPAALAAALNGKTLPADVAKVAVRVAQAAGKPDANLVAALTSAGKLGQAKADLTSAERDQFVSDVPKLGDPARGEHVYRRAELNCLKCHAIAGAGGQVGPDMTSIGGSAPVDYLLDSVLYPNKQIKEGYHSLVVNLDDGRVATGIKIRESKTELVLRDAEGAETAYPVADVTSRKDGQSLMPAGLVEPLTRQELLDLVRFLSELGKPGGHYAATPGKAARRFAVLQPTREVYTAVSRDRLGAVAVPGAGFTWQPAYTLVSGDLPVSGLTAFKAHGGSSPTAVVRFEVEVTTPGRVKLTFPDPTGLTVWAAGNPVDLAAGGVVELPAGTHAVVVAIDTGARPGSVRAEVDEVAGSSARARVVGGR